MLTQARLKEFLHYSPDTGVFTHIKPRGGIRVGDMAGRKCHGYLQISIDGKRYLAHRLAWLYIHGEFPPNCIDHVNRDRADNRIVNLRLATRGENQQNQSMHSNNTSGYQGVCWHKKTGKWMARIKLNGKESYLGLFADIADAVAARCTAKANFHKFQPEQI